MTKTTKIVRTVYLYIVALISLGFTAAGIGNLINTTLKAYVFTAAESRDYQMCSRDMYFMYSFDAESVKKQTTSEIDKEKVDNLLRDYENWKQENTGEACIKSEREKRMVDSLTMILIALPLYLIHWRMVRKEKQEKES